MDERIIKLIGINNFNKIKKAKVCIVGLGGVGGYALEGLIRSGVENIIIVDHDTIDRTNLNRQIITSIDNIDNKKIDEAFKRALSINSNCSITKLNLFLDEANINQLFDLDFDYLIDACDTITTKELLIKNCINNNIKIISCMGTGNKLNMMDLEINDIRKTSYDPIAKKIRKYLNDEKIYSRVDVVYSKEKRDKFVGSIPSMVFVPATAGLLCSNYVIKDIIKN